MKKKKVKLHLTSNHLILSYCIWGSRKITLKENAFLFCLGYTNTNFCVRFYSANLMLLSPSEADQRSGTRIKYGRPG